jgi:glc operon protein GlcG
VLTKAFEDLANGGRPAISALPIEGAIPLMADGKVIGAIGVSGSAPSQDAQVAQVGGCARGAT